MKVAFVRPNMSRRRAADALQPLEISVLVGLTPRDVTLELYDERLEEIPTDLDADLIAMTVQTFTARRAYELADRFRAQGRRVVLGGYHPTFLPEEALAHADAVVIGEAEQLWPRVLEDVRRGRLSPTYQQASPSVLDGIRYDRRAFSGKSYSRIFPIEFNRGCRYHCDFCSVTVFNRAQVRSRPVKDVIQDIEEARARILLIVDDNLLHDRASTCQLLEALIPMRVQWGCQIGLEAARDPQLVRLLSRSGCAAALVGFESLREENLRQMRKPVSGGGAKEALRIFRDHGIMVCGSFVFGYDHDTVDVFGRTLDFALEERLFLANFNTLNPLPLTPLYDRLLREGRLLCPRWWLDERYPYGEVTFRPARMAVAQLREGCMQARRGFFQASSMARRLLDPKANARSLSHVLLYLGTNLVARRELQAKMLEVGNHSQ